MQFHVNCSINGAVKCKRWLKCDLHTIRLKREKYEKNMRRRKCTACRIIDMPTVQTSMIYKYNSTVRGN